jgi:hypothetical protein
MFLFKFHRGSERSIVYVVFVLHIIRGGGRLYMETLLDYGVYRVYLISTDRLTLAPNHRVLVFLSSRRIGHTNPLTREQVLLPSLWVQRGGETHSLAAEGMGRTNSDEATDTLVIDVLGA